MTVESLFILAQSGTESFRTTEIDLPESTAGILILLLGLAVLFGTSTWTSLRDSRFLKPVWRVLLFLLAHGRAIAGAGRAAESSGTNSENSDPAISCRNPGGYIVVDGLSGFRS